MQELRRHLQGSQLLHWEVAEGVQMQMHLFQRDRFRFADGF